MFTELCKCLKQYGLTISLWRATNWQPEMMGSSHGAPLANNLIISNPLMELLSFYGGERCPLDALSSLLFDDFI